MQAFCSAPRRPERLSEDDRRKDHRFRRLSRECSAKNLPTDLAEDFLPGFTTLPFLSPPRPGASFGDGSGDGSILPGTVTRRLDEILLTMISCRKILYWLSLDQRAHDLAARVLARLRALILSTAKVLRNAWAVIALEGESEGNVFDAAKRITDLCPGRATNRRGAPHGWWFSRRPLVAARQFDSFRPLAYQFMSAGSTRTLH